MRLPGQLAAVDPIVASFCGGAVGVLSTLIVVEANNASQQARRRCCYCQARAPPAAPSPSVRALEATLPHSLTIARPIGSSAAV